MSNPSPMWPATARPEPLIGRGLAEARSSLRHDLAWLTGAPAGRRLGHLVLSARRVVRGPGRAFLYISIDLSLSLYLDRHGDAPASDGSCMNFIAWTTVAPAAEAAAAGAASAAGAAAASTCTGGCSDSTGGMPMWRTRRLRPTSASQLALREPLSVPDRASGCPALRPASANQPLGPRWPAISALFFT